MQVQFNSGHHIEGTADVAARIEAQLRDRLERFVDRLSRLEIHVRDENGSKSHGEDKSCMIEARIEGDKPISVTAHADTVDAAASQAGSKLAKMLERHFSKLGDRNRAEPKDAY